jgi:hypothetical protein
MVAGIHIAAAVLVGYGVAVGCLLLATFALTSASPRMVLQEHRITNRYKWVQSLLWLGCSALGGFVACAVAVGRNSLVVEALLAAALISILWINTWEARQRGIAHQLLMSVVPLLGVAAGFTLEKHFIKL